MSAIALDATAEEDPRFVRIVEAFIRHYGALYVPPRIVVVRIDHWFGEKWLGFRGKLLGALGIHSDVSDLARKTMPLPPFSPTRVQDSRQFTRHENGWACEDGGGCHLKKNGGDFRDVILRGLYCWYSGGTRTNTNGSLMIYDVNAVGGNGWYVSFDLKDNWRLSRCVNVSRDECNHILSNFNATMETEQSIGHEALDRSF